MPTRLFTLGAWNHLAYTDTANPTITDTDYVDWLDGKSNGYLTGSGGTLAAVYNTSATPIVTDGGEVWYKRANNQWKSVYFLPGLNKTMSSTSKLNSAIYGGGKVGCELHYSSIIAFDKTYYAYGYKFSIGGSDWTVYWSNDDGLTLWEGSTQRTWDSRSSASNAATQAFKIYKIQIFESSDSKVKIKAYCVEGAKTVLAYYTSGVKTISSLTWGTTASGTVGQEKLGDLSFYSIDSSERAGLETNWTSNNLQSFKREIPLMFDKANTGGTAWVGSDTTAHADITDGSATTYASNPSNSNPIGFTTNGLDLGTIAAKCWVWESGTLAQLSSIGTIKGVKHTAYKATVGENTNLDFKAVGAGDTVTKTVPLSSSVSGATVSAEFLESDVATMALTTSSTMTNTLQNG